MVTNGIVKNHEFLQKEQVFMCEYANGNMNIQHYIRHTIEPLVDLSVKEIDHLAWQCIHQHISPIIYPAAKVLIQQLQIQQIQMVIISATVSFLVKKIAQQLGISQAIGIDLQMYNQHYCPEIQGIASFQEGKIARLQHWLAEQEQAQQYVTCFYTDSINDLPLCQYADQVYLVNPCSQLRRYNQQTHWPVEYWLL